MNKNIFIVGCPRSGTTFTQSFLAAHPLVYATPETQFFIELIGYHNLIRRMQVPTLKAQLRISFARLREDLGLAQNLGKDVRREVRYFLRGVDRLDLFSEFPRYDPRIYALARAFLFLINQLMQDAGKTHWVEKSPNHLFSIEAIEELVPNSLFIHVLRSGKDTVASLNDMARQNPKSFWHVFADPIRGVRRWNACIDESLLHTSSANHYMLRYENLVEQPETTLHEMCRFLGLDYTPMMLENRTKVAQQITYKVESHKQQVQQGIDRNTDKKFGKLFSAEEQARILAALRPVDWTAVLASNEKKLNAR